MTDIEQKALALVNEVCAEKGGSPIDYDTLFGAGDVVALALCLAIEQHEAFRRGVSDALKKYFSMDWNTHKMAGDLRRFIITKPDPLVEAWKSMFPRGDCGNCVDVEMLRAALEARGLTITTVEKD